MTLINDFLSLIYPRLCLACGHVLFNHEHHLCGYCINHLPRYDAGSHNNLLLLLAGRVPLQEAASVFEFEKSSEVQKILHAIKYQGQKEAAEFIGQFFGDEWKTASVFSHTDIILPVPLHKNKLSQRGYNQSEWFAKGISAALGKPLLPDGLQRIRETETQTKKKKYERWENVEGIFEIENPLEFENKHVLLVDDVVTTGATVEAAFQPMKNISGIKISLACLAFAKI